MKNRCTSKATNADAGRMLPSFSIIAVVVFLFTLLFYSPQAFAATTQSQFPNKAALPQSWSCGGLSIGHCYGIRAWGGANGAETRISLNPLLSGGGSQNDVAESSFVTTEMWLQTSGTAAYWVEGGIISEIYETGSTYPFFFWADSRPNGGGFSFHVLSTRIATTTGNALVHITRSGSSNWNVLLQDGGYSYTGTSISNNITIGSIVVGTELHNNYETAYEPVIQYTNNRWLGGNGSFNYQANDGIWKQVNYPVQADWYQNQYPSTSSTGGDWYSCIPGYGGC